MLNNITNFFNLIKTGKVKTQLDGTDLLPIGTRDTRFTGQYQPTMIKYSDLVAGLVGGSNGQVLFNDNDTIAGASNFYFNKTSNRVGIGTPTPGSELHIDGHNGFGASLKITTDKVGGVAYIQMVSDYVTGFEQTQHGGPGWGWPNWTTIRTGGTAAAPTAVPNDYGLNEYTFFGHDGSSVAQAYSMLTRAAQTWTPSTRGIYTTFNTVVIGAANPSERMRFTGTGNLQVNNNLLVGTSTDAGYRLDVNGTFRALVSTETNPFVVQHTNGNFASIVIGNGSQFAPGQFGMHFNGAGVWSWSGNAFRIHGGILTSNANAITFQLIGGFGGSTLGTSIKLGANTFNAGQFTATSGNQNTVEIGTTNNETWAPTSGNATYNLFVVAPRINTSGTYAGIVRGIIYAPTLTSTTGVTHRALELTSGDFIWGTGYSQYYGNSIEGFIQFTTSGTSTQIWLRPPNNPNNYGTSYYSKISHTNADLTVNSGQYGCLYFGANGFGASSNSMVLHNAAANTQCNLLLGTTINAGFLLDVNGTARVSATDGVSGFQITAPTRAWYFTTSASGGTFNAISGSINGTAGTGNFGYVLGGGWGFNIGLTTSQPNSFFSVYPSATNNGEVRIGGQTGNGTSLLTLESTTKGFLPPRMTTTEKNAIASPAAGLMVYDNTLNRPCFYNGTSWITL